jgi:hypothetical protein
MRTLAFASAIALLGLASTAEAHFILMSPAPNNPADATQGKGGLPCGPDMAVAANPTAAQGGHTISLKLQETVRHGGFYRVALSINSRSEIPVDNVVYDASKPPKVLPPSGMPSGTSDHADFENPAVFPVLGDDLFPHAQAGASGQVYMMDIMLPNVTCAHCTMQIIEFMEPHGYNGTPGKNDGGGYFYHHCADLKITADPTLPPFPSSSDGGANDAAGGSDAGSAGTHGTGTGGSLGQAGAEGSGAAGSTVTGSSGAGGEAGNSSGTSGSSGTAGSPVTGGMAGTIGGGSGAGGSQVKSSSGGGCNVEGESGSALHFGATMFLMGLGAMIARRRRARRNRPS